MRTLDHCLQGKTVGWKNVVIYLDGEKSTSSWIEVNAAEGWGIKYSEPLECVGEVIKTERIEGNFGIYILYNFEIHLDYRAETIVEARKKMDDIMDSLARLRLAPYSNCLSFNDPDDQAEYEKILSSE